MNRPAFYTYNPRHATRAHGPFLERADADRYANELGHVVTTLTGNEILRARIRVVAPR